MLFQQTARGRAELEENTQLTLSFEEQQRNRKEGFPNNRNVFMKSRVSDVKVTELMLQRSDLP